MNFLLIDEYYCLNLDNVNYIEHVLNEDPHVAIHFLGGETPLRLRLPDAEVEQIFAYIKAHTRKAEK